MHGQNRSEYKARTQNPSILNKLSRRASQYSSVSKSLIQRRKNTSTQSKSYQQETLLILQTVLTINPDPSHLWNYRREVVVSLCKSSAAHYNDVVHSMSKERDLVIKCLHKNSKAYSIWFHWKWCLRHWLCFDIKIFLETGKWRGEKVKSREITLEMTAWWTQLLNGELELCEELLMLDERNFHCWNYRRFVVSALALILSVKRIPMNTGNIDKMEQMIQHLDGSWNWIQQPSSHHVNMNYSMFIHTLNNESKAANEVLFVMGAQISTKATDKSTTLSTATSCNILLTDSEKDQLLATEWNFIQSKVLQNFSNYSALHYRSKLVLLLFHRALPSTPTQQQRSDLQYQVVKTELELLTNAIFTEPDDQSPWWYHNFLMDWIKPSISSMNDNPAVWKLYEHILEQEFQSIRMLVQGEKGRCKWGLLALVKIINARVYVWKLQQQQEDEGNSEDSIWWKGKAKDYMESLISLDPSKKERYIYMMEQMHL